MYYLFISNNLYFHSSYTWYYLNVLVFCKRSILLGLYLFYLDNFYDIILKDQKSLLNILLKIIVCIVIYFNFPYTVETQFAISFGPGTMTVNQIDC